MGEKLAKQLAKSKHQIILFEKDSSVARRLAAELDATVLNADGTEKSNLLDAKVDEVGAFIAVTGDDKVNLFACQLAAKLGAKRVMARVNDPEDLEFFLVMGITAINTTLVTVAAIEESIRHEGNMPQIASIADDKGRIVRLLLSGESSAVGRKATELSFAKNILAISRGERLLFVGGCTFSTAGGLKVIRTMIAFRSVPWLVRNNMMPSSAVSLVKIGNNTCSNNHKGRYWVLG